MTPEFLDSWQNNPGLILEKLEKLQDRFYDIIDKYNQIEEDLERAEISIRLSLHRIRKVDKENRDTEETINKLAESLESLKLF